MLDWLGGLSPFYIYKQCSSMLGLCARLTRGVHLPSIYIYMYKQCSSMQELCAQLTGGSISLLYIYINSVVLCKASVLDWPGGFISLLYIYKQCSSMQGLCAQLTYIYISSVVVCKASVLDWPGGVHLSSIYMHCIRKCHSCPLDVSSYVKSPFLTTRCQ